MSHAPTPALERRAAAVREQMAARGIGALVVTSLPNITYLTNFTGTSAIVVLEMERLAFITDSRYVTAVGRLARTPGFELVTVEGTYDGTLAWQLNSLGAVRIGFEAADLSVSRHQWLSDKVSAGAPPPTLVATEGIVERARAVKDEYEIATLREAGRRLAGVADELLAIRLKPDTTRALGPTRILRAGVTEREVAHAIDSLIWEAGFSKPAFDTIVASGPNSALPHARPGERRLSEGDLVVLDFGGVYDSYCVDLTRTVSIGKASARAREVYDAVREAHDRAVAVVRPGVSRFAVDAAARDALAARGLGEAFGHGTGHGLGLEVHEDPRIVRRRPDADSQDEMLSAGMVFTIEPGAYLPEWGGVRIENDVLVTPSGVEMLTGQTTEIVEI